MELFTEVALQGLMLILILSLFPLLASLIVGLVVSLLQTITQIQEHTLTFVPKIIATLIVLMISVPWMLGHLTNFAKDTFELMIRVSR
jgi:flagellar biosynthetic protein FliQ